MFCSLLRVTGCDACSRCPSSCATHCLPVFTSCYRLDQSSAFVRTTYICFAPAARACVPLFFLIADSWAHLCSGPAPAIGRVAASELSSPLASRHARRRASPGTAPRPWRSRWPIPCRIRRLRFSSVCLARCLFFSALLSGEDLPRPYHCRSGCWIGQCLTRFHGLVPVLFWIRLCLRSFQSHVFVAVPICRFFFGLRRFGLSILLASPGSYLHLAVAPVPRRRRPDPAPLFDGLMDVKKALKDTE